MFCPNCGCKLDDDALFCEQCGTQITEEPMQENQAQENEVPSQPSPAPKTPGKGSELLDKVRSYVKGNKKKVGIAAGAVVAVIAVIAVIIFMVTRPLTVNLNKYVTVEYSGCNSVGTAQVSFDSDAFYEDYEKKITYSGSDSTLGWLGEISPSELLLEMCVDGNLDKSKGLTNGDSIVYHWDCDDEDAKNNFGVRLSHKDITFTVEGLTEPEEVDPFADIEVEFTGTAPNARVDVQKDSNKEYLYDLYFEVSTQDGLNNGDTVTVSVSDADSEDFKSLLLERRGIVLTQTSKTYTVEGLDSYVTSLSAISDDSLEQIKTQCNDILTANVAKNWSDECTLSQATYVGNYLLTAKNTNRYGNQNILYLVYQLDATIVIPDKGVNETISFYYPIGYRDVVVDADGAVTNDLSNYTSPYGGFNKSYGFNWIYFKGFESLDDVFKNCVTANVDQYNYESTVNAE